MGPDRGGGNSVIGELETKKAAANESMTYVSPYSDSKVIGGQGTIAVEIERKGNPIDVVFVPMVGGGLAAGIAGYMKARDPSVRVVPRHGGVGASRPNRRARLRTVCEPG